MNISILNERSMNQAFLSVVLFTFNAKGFSDGARILSAPLLYPSGYRTAPLSRATSLPALFRHFRNCHCFRFLQETNQLRLFLCYFEVHVNTILNLNIVVNKCHIILVSNINTETVLMSNNFMTNANFYSWKYHCQFTILSSEHIILLNQKISKCKQRI